MAAGKGASLLGLRELNARTVLDVIREKAPISRAQLSRLVDLTRPTVASAIDTLLDAGLVRETPSAGGQLGYGARFFEPAPDAAYFVGLDIDRNQFRAVLADATGRVVVMHEERALTREGIGVVGRATARTAELCRQAGIAPSLLAVAVVGVPAAVDPRDGRLRLSAYTPLEGFPLGAALAEALDLPVVVDNDVNLAAIGEHTQGVAVGVDNFAYLTIGRNVGAGIVLRGEILTGCHGAAGEVDSPAHGSAYLSDSPAADAFASFATRMIAESGQPLRPTPTAVFAAARRGDALALRILAVEAERIAERAALLCRVVDVELVVLGGGIGRRCHVILDDIRTHLQTLVRFTPRVEISELADRPVLVGARAVGVRTALAVVTASRLAAVLAGRSG